MPAETPLIGGADPSHGVVRIGDTVRRPARATSASVRALLLHLERVGFDGAPRYLGTDEHGREVLTFIDGEVPLPPYPAWSMTAAALASLGRLLRRLHEATAGLDRAGISEWSTEWADPTGGPVICHNDVFPENVVFRDGRVIALIDFDMAAPGRPMWDLAIAVGEWAPLHAPSVRDAYPAALDAVRRAGLLARAYGVERAAVPELLRVIDAERHQALTNIRMEVAAGNPAWTPIWSDSHGEERTAADDAWIAQIRSVLANSLAGLDPRPT